MDGHAGFAGEQAPTLRRCQASHTSRRLPRGCYGAVVITSWGACVPERLEYSTALVLPPLTAKLTGLPLATAEVTLNSTQVPIVAAPAVPSEFPEIGGALFQVMPVSVQPLPTMKTEPPAVLAFVTKSRNRAPVTVPFRVGTLNRR